MKRNIIRIDEEKCNGCGLCIPNCAEGSLEIRNGKAVLVKEALCDGLGACLGHCPEDALIIEERDSDAFDEELVEERLKQLAMQEAAQKADEAPGCGCSGGSMPSFGGCPSAQVTNIKAAGADADESGDKSPSHLAQWPVQLGLLPPTAPFFKDADLLLAADCVPFAYPDFHRDFLKGKAVAMACPKLDNADAHYQKLVALFAQSGIKSITVARMEVPCCGGLVAMAKAALRDSGSTLELNEVVVGRDGSIQQG
jgi:NAD-dependent dihydropyrimidine dehydrogenase PreA subunit